MKELTPNELRVLEAIALASDDNCFCLCDVRIPIHSTSGTCATLQKKGYINMFNGECYFDGQLTQKAVKLLKNI
jgi:hypothetical protein